MKKILFVLALCLMVIGNVEARPPHNFGGPIPHVQHIHHPVVKHYYTPVRHQHSDRVFWNTFAGAVAGTVIGSFLVQDSYITYNQRANVPQNCVTLVNQTTGYVTTQCSQDGSQIIMVNP